VFEIDCASGFRGRRAIVSTREETRDYYDRNAAVYDAKTGFDLDSGQV